MSQPEHSRFEALVEAFDGKLTGADRALIGAILAEPSEAVYLSSAELAAKADVHASTVVRLARKLGFEGYPDMRARLRADLETRNLAADEHRQRMRRIEGGASLLGLIESEIAAIAAVANTVTQERIDAAAEVLGAAGTIFVVGRGSAAPLVAHFERRLRRLGIACRVALNLQRRDLADHLIGMTRGDAVVVFGFQGPGSLPSGYSALIEAAGELGARVVAIGDASILTARPAADIALAVSRPDEGVMQIRSGPMIVCEALALAIGHRNAETSVKGLESLERLRARLLNGRGGK